MIEMHTLQSKYQDIQIRATKAELHIIPLLSDGSYEDRTIIPRDSRAGWYVGNRYFETERGSGPYTMHEFGGDTTYVRHSITSSSLLFANGKLYNRRQVDALASTQYHSRVFGLIETAA